MLDKRLLNTLAESKIWIKRTVLVQILQLLTAIVSAFTIAWVLQLAYQNKLSTTILGSAILILVVSFILRATLSKMANSFSCKASVNVKHHFRTLIYQKLIVLFQNNQNHQYKNARIIQIVAEGVETLEIYFARFTPQLYYAMIAPLILFVFLAWINWQAALVLLICVPLIPFSIVLFFKIASKLMGRHFAMYSDLAGSFLDNLQGLPTLKVYQDDGYKAQVMDTEASKFRNITMRVLAMQLNSITIMDILAYGGAALGIITSLYQFKAGNIELWGVIAFIILSIEFFLPLRLLGSFFHIAMTTNAVVASIYKLLDIPINPTLEKNQTLQAPISITMKDLSFAYEEDRPILSNISVTMPAHSLTVFAGRSGCGKSTIASLLLGFNKGFTGDILFNNKAIQSLETEDFYRHVCIVSHQNYIFADTLRNNMLMANASASDDDIYLALEKVNLADFVRANGGLDFKLTGQGANLSGGQAQRLSLARAILHDADVYVFDEATSNIDVDSEKIIMDYIVQIKHTKTVILISHRLANAVNADRIYVLDKGQIVETGTHDQLMQQQHSNIYQTMYQQQKDLEALVQRDSLS